VAFAGFITPPGNVGSPSSAMSRVVTTTADRYLRHVLDIGRLRHAELDILWRRRKRMDIASCRSGAWSHPESGGRWRCSGWSEYTCDQCSYSGKLLVCCFG
jgi:hypothetical protein